MILNEAFCNTKGTQVCKSHTHTYSLYFVANRDERCTIPLHLYEESAHQTYQRGHWMMARPIEIPSVQ